MPIALSRLTTALQQAYPKMQMKQHRKQYCLSLASINILLSFSSQKEEMKNPRHAQVVNQNRASLLIATRSLVSEIRNEMKNLSRERKLVGVRRRKDSSSSMKKLQIRKIYEMLKMAEVTTCNIKRFLRKDIKVNYNDKQKYIDTISSFG